MASRSQSRIKTSNTHQQNKDCPRTPARRGRKPNVRPVQISLINQSSIDNESKKQVPSTSANCEKKKQIGIEQNESGTGPNREDQSPSIIDQLEPIPKTQQKKHKYISSSAKTYKYSHENLYPLDDIAACQSSPIKNLSLELILDNGEKKSSGNTQNFCRKKIYAVPYRKCQSHIEERVVSIINKLKNGKQCSKEIYNLSSKIGKVSRKDLVNRYFVSGIKVILDLIRKNERQESNKQLVSHLQEMFSDFNHKIIEYLDNTEEYENKETEFVIDESPELRRKLIRKIYKVLKQKSLKQKKDLMKMSVQKVDNFFELQKPSLAELFISLAG